VIRVELRDFAFAPAEIAAQVGEEVRIVAVNVTDLPHELFIGSPEEQAEHHLAHASAPPADQGTLEDGVAGTYVPARGSAQFTYRFEKAGDLVMGCHLIGHFEAGMVGVIHVSVRP